MPANVKPALTRRIPPTTTIRRVLAAALTVLAAAPAGASADSFYTPPSPLPAGQPGDVIRSEPMTAYTLPGVQMPARAWRILYRSTTAQGQPTAVSGTVLVPTAPWTGTGPRPLIGYAIGSQGLADTCAPSNQLAAGTEYEATVIDDVLANGWAVALTDYQGLGTPGDHPYVVGRAIGPDVLDSMRAALHLPADGLSPHAPLAIYGYSEGGSAAGWAAELQPAYAPDLPLVGVADGGVPADLLATLKADDGTTQYWLAAYGLVGFNAAYPELHLDDYLNAQGRQLVARLQSPSNCFPLTPVTEAALSVFGNHISDYLTTNPFAAPAVLARLEQNRLGTTAPQAPVFQGHATNDEAIPYAQDLTLYHEWCALGVNDHFLTIPLLEHITGAGEFAPAAINFLAQRLAGTPLPRASNCIANPTATNPTLTVWTITKPRRLHAHHRALVDILIRALQAGKLDPVPGVVVMIAGRHLTTDADGDTTVVIRPRRPGTVTITATKPGYLQGARTLRIFH